MNIQNLVKTISPPDKPVKATRSFNLATAQQSAQQSVEAEVRRIVDLPITKQLTEDDVRHISRHYLSEEHFNKGDRLRPEQAMAMIHYNDYGGIFVTLGVGGGKTLICFMVANDCYKKIIAQRQQGTTDKEARILIVVQANLLTKFENDVTFMRKFLKELPPIYILGGVSKQKRTMLAKSGRRGVYVCSYHTLQSKDATDILNSVKPCQIICDEAQNVAGTKDSARAKRFRTYVNEQQPEVVPLSGTMTRKSVMEYYFLSKAALGKYNFLPNSYTMATEWAGVLDSVAASMGDFRNDNMPRPGPINWLPTWCHTHFPKVELPPNLVGFRRAFAHRMTSAPGVICSTQEDPVGKQLIFHNNPCKGMETAEGWPVLKDHLEVLTEDFVTPSGEELSCAMNVWGYRYQMEATGFFYDLYWRDPETIAKSKGLSLSAAEDVLERSKEYHEKHKTYQATLRRWLSESSRPKLDTPALVGSNMKHHRSKYVGDDLYQAWITWKEAAFIGMEVRQQKPVRVCDFKIKQVATDAKKNIKRGGIIWYQHTEMGYWMMDELRKVGVPATHCPSEEGAHKFLEDTHGMSGTWIVASLGGHSTGKDLQWGFCDNYFLQVPVSASLIEQTIGRTHRPGQPEDAVNCYFYMATDFDIAHFNVVLKDTAYVQQSTTGKMKLMVGTYTFRPRSIPYTALAEMGAKVCKLGKDAEKLIEGIFG